MAERKPPLDPSTFAEQMGDIPTATDRVRLVGLDHASRVQKARQGAVGRRLALTRARRADNQTEIARLEAAVATEARAQQGYRIAAQTAEVEVPGRKPDAFVLHGRVFQPDGVPASELTVAAINADGQVNRFTCTDAKGYFRMDMPSEATDDHAGETVFLQVSDADQAVLYRGDEAIEPHRGGVVYREIRLSGERLPPCPLPPDRATMPNVLDRPESGAVAVLNRFGLDVAQRLTQQAPGRVGLVVSQEPPAGTPITADTSVTLVIGVAEQADTIIVPDVTGRSRDEAQARLKEAGLAVGQITTRPGEPVGTVLSQNPKAGTRVSPGTAVSLAIATRPEEDRVEIPDLVGRKQPTAEDLLREVGLTRGRLTFRDDAQAGVVLDQEPKAGTLVSAGARVDLVVSRRSEAERTEVPNLRGRPLEAAKEILAATRLRLGEVDGPENGRVIAQDPTAGQPAAIGSAVHVKLSRRDEPRPEDFVDRLTKHIAEDRMFETLGMSQENLRELLIARQVTSADSAKRTVELEDAAIQELFRLHNRNQARSFRRMLREAIGSS